MRHGLLKPTPILLAALTLLALTACMRPQASPGELLIKSLRSFHNDLIFMRYDQASAHVPQSQRRDFITYYQDQEEPLNIMEYEIVRLEVTPDEHYAEAEVELVWYQLPSTKVQRTRMLERWEFNADLSTWVVVEQQPKAEAQERSTALSGPGGNSPGGSSPGASGANRAF